LPRRKRPAWAQYLQPVPPLVQATLTFANDGRFQAPGDTRVVTSDSNELIAVLRDYVRAQIAAVAHDGQAVDLDMVECDAWDRLHDHALRHAWQLDQVLSREAIDVEAIRRDTTLALQSIQHRANRLRQCRREGCGRWIFAAHGSHTVCSDGGCLGTKPVKIRPSRAAYMRDLRWKKKFLSRGVTTTKTSRRNTF
jgi:hypothetical protein